MSDNKTIPEGYMTVGQVAKKMGVTVRTLQYYDKEGLLPPKAKGDADFIQIKMSLNSIRFFH